MDHTTPPPPKSLLTLRALVLLTIAVALGVGVGFLTIATGAPLAAAALAGVSSFGGSLQLLHELVE